MGVCLLFLETKMCRYNVYLALPAKEWAVIKEKINKLETNNLAIPKQYDESLFCSDWDFEEWVLLKWSVMSWWGQYEDVELIEQYLHTDSSYDFVIVGEEIDCYEHRHNNCYPIFFLKPAVDIYI